MDTLLINTDEGQKVREHISLRPRPPTTYLVVWGV